MEATGNWSNGTSQDYVSWDPTLPVYCYSVNEHNIKSYLIAIYRIIGPILVCLCAISVIGNTAILLTVVYMRKKHLTPTLMLSLSMAGADAVAAMAMGLGFFINNILLYNFEIDVTYRDCIVLVVETFRLGSMVSSALHFVVLAVNHWMGITKPLHYASRMTRKTAVICIVAMWILPVMVFIAYFSLVPDQGFQSTKCGVVDFAHHFAFRSFVSALFFIPLALMSIVYLHVFYEIQRHQKKLCSLDAAGASSDEKRRMQSNTKALVTTLIILLTYLIGWLPAVINYVTVCVDCVVPLTISLCVRLPVNIVTNLLIILKFLVDPIIYTARIQEVRTVIKYFLERGGCRKPDDTHRAFNRFDTSQSGSLMASLRYSTYRQRKESDSSTTLQRLSSQNCHSTPMRKSQPLLTVNGASVTRGGISTTESNGLSGRREMPSQRPASLTYPAHSPLMEVSEGLVSPTDEVAQNGDR